MIGSIVVESLAKTYPGRFAVKVTGVYADEIYRHSPHVVPQLPRHVHRIMLEQPLIHKARNGHSFAFSMCHYVGTQLGIELIPQVGHPVLYFSNEEKRERPFERPYVLLNAGWKPDGELKHYRHYQAVVDLLGSAFPDLAVIQIGESYHFHPRLTGKNVVDMVGRWDRKARPLMWWALHSELGLGPITFLMHVYGAVDKPYVCLAGGREPLTWACNYRRQRYLSRYAECAGCWLRQWKQCKDMIGPKEPRCLDIAAQAVADEVADILGRCGNAPIGP